MYFSRLLRNIALVARARSGGGRPPEGQKHNESARRYAAAAISAPKRWRGCVGISLMSLMYASPMAGRHASFVPHALMLSGAILMPRKANRSRLPVNRVARPQSAHRRVTHGPAQARRYSVHCGMDMRSSSRAGGSAIDARRGAPALRRR